MSAGRLWFRSALLATLWSLSCARCAPKTPSAAPADWLAGRFIALDDVPPHQGGELTVRLAVEPQGFTRIHDAFAEGTMVRATTGTLYECFARIDADAPEGPLLPWLATRWSIDGGQLTIDLREGVVFHDGSPFGAEDAQVVLGAIIKAGNPTVAMRASLGAPTAVEVAGPHRLVVRWAAAPSSLVVRALLSSVPMMPASAVSGDFDTAPIHQAPVGTGPFVFVKATRGAGFELKRFERHRQPAFLERLTFKVVRDDTVAVQAWQRGDFDVMTRIPAAVWRDVEKQPWAWQQYRRYRIDENTYAWFGWNRQRPLFADVRVRRALAMLYPAEAVSMIVELGLESRTTCPFLLGSKSCDASVVPLPFDPPRAMQLLDEAGWRDDDGDGVREREGQPLSFSFMTVASSQRLSRVVALFQEQLTRAGVRLTIEPVDAAASIARMRAHDFDAAALIWSSPDAVTDQYDLFHSSQLDGGKNYVALADGRVDGLLEQIRREHDPVTRQGLERELHRLLFADQVYLFLTARPALDAVKRRVHGLRPSLVGYDFARAWVEP